MMTPLRQQLETALDFISRAALGHDTGHCVHFANKAEAEIRGTIDALNVLLAESEVLKAGPQGFFAYSSDCGYEEFDTAEKAMAHAEDEIADYRGYACDGWSDEVGSVVWGVVMQRATMVDLHDATEEDGCDPAIKRCCDYALLPVIETPATSAALAAIRTDSHIAGLEAAANRIGVISRNYKPGQKQELIKAIGRDVLQYAIELREAK